MVTTGALWSLGDALAQRVEKGPFNARRNLLTAGYGALAVGPFGHAWYIGLDRAARRLFVPGSPAFIAAKVIADTAIFGPLHVAGYFTHMTLSEGGTLPDVGAKLRTDFWPTFSAELFVWPVVQVANFKLVPVHYQLLVVNMVTILDSCFMSWARANDGWFQRLFPELAAQLGLLAPPSQSGPAAVAAAGRKPVAGAAAAVKRPVAASSAKTSGAEGNQIFVVVRRGKEYPPKVCDCRIKYEQTIADLKKAAAAKLGVPLDKLLLFWQTKELTAAYDSKTLLELNLHTGFSVSKHDLPALRELLDGPEGRQAAQETMPGSHQLLESLLQQGHPEVPRFQRDFYTGQPLEEPVWLSYDGWWQYYDILGESCSFYVLFRTAGTRTGHCIWRHPVFGGQLGKRQLALDAEALRCCEVLLAAGYRPTLYAEVELESRMADGDFSDRAFFENFNILTDWHRAGNVHMSAAPRLNTPTGRLMLLLVDGKAWSPAVHKFFPPAFKAAARTLLLAHHRGGGSSPPARGRTRRKAGQAPQQPTLLSLVPGEFVLQAIQLAAFPASAWLPLQPDGSQAWLQAAAAEPAGPEADAAPEVVPEAATNA
ncbi:PXMP2 4 family 2-like [Chlorella sorokiniana]|uniref:PXMP2 4 family 2-like n=1 Tax=Chlorella sorokiniana TaxID=3076 RepID=A0A2P6TKM0_CHLSO|nr:PXMP2 4 family 2-like [Chlorella sorokiniana]|eukprot:PRW44616.1 PXMP2 4 family 2-like [Chlorella sorokiniana]